MKSSFTFTFALSSAMAGGLLVALAIAFVAPVRPHYPPYSAHHQTHQIAAIPFSDGARQSDRSNFYSEIAEVNARMHEGMAIAPTGDINRDFVRMMIAHHQGAIDMARTLLKLEPDERLRRLAQSIIVEQAEEITYMRLLNSSPPITPISSLPIANQ
jgi:hypothetical protein